MQCNGGKLRQDGGPITSVGGKLTDDGTVRLHVCVCACHVPRLVGKIYTIIIEEKKLIISDLGEIHNIILLYACMRYVTS